MYNVTIEFSTEWSSRKQAEMERDIVRYLAQRGAPNAKWNVEGGPPKEQYLHLGCGACAADQGKDYDGWYATTFEECPIHGRDAIAKMQPGRVDLPEGKGPGNPTRAPEPAATADSEQDPSGPDTQSVPGKSDQETSATSSSSTDPAEVPAS